MKRRNESRISARGQKVREEKKKKEEEEQTETGAEVPSRPSSSSSSSSTHQQTVALGDIPDYAALAQLVGMDVESGDDDVEPSLSSGSSASGKGPQTQLSQSVRSLSLSSVARAESILKKSLPVVRGGTHVQFTREDLERIRDPEVLQFLEENSSMFKKYIKPDNEGHSPLPDAAESDKTSAPKGISAAELQKSIMEFQREIDTFITAVDNSGRAYHIELDENGTLQVPIDDDEDDDVFFSGGDDDDDAFSGVGEDPLETTMTPPATRRGDDPSRLAAGSRSGSARSSGSLSGRRRTKLTVPIPSHEEERVLEGEKKDVGEHTLSVRSQSNTTTEGGLKEKTESQKLALEKGSKKKVVQFPRSSEITSGRKNPSPQKRRTARSSNKIKASAPAVVKPVRAFLPEEEERIGALLKDSAPTALLGHNPFIISEETNAKLLEDEKKLEALRLVRGPLPPRRQPLTLDYAPLVVQEKPGSAATLRSKSTATAGVHKALGNKYMAEMKEKQKMEKALAKLNAAILANQREIEQLSAQDGESEAPEELLQLRPEWVRKAVIPLATEDEVQHLLTEARAEEAEAEKHGLRRQGSHEDPYVALLTRLHEAAARAEEMTKEWSSNPLQRSSPPPPLPTDPADAGEVGDSDSFSELGDIPDNIKDDMFDLI